MPDYIIDWATGFDTGFFACGLLWIIVEIVRLRKSIRQQLQDRKISKEVAKWKP